MWPTTKEAPLDWFTRAEQSGIEYLVFQLEKAPATGKLHLQGYVALTKRTTLATLKRLLSATAHWEVCRGKPAENRAYCTKDGRINGPWEYGTCPGGKGTRTDLTSIYAAIKAGKTNYELLEASEGKAAKFEKAINFQRFAVNERTSDRQLQGVRVVVLYGPTGKGKSYAAINYFGSEDYYVQECPSSKGTKLWFDGYQAQRTLVLDDFESDFCQYRYLLRLLDKYKLKVEIKGSFAWAQWTTVVMTSNTHPCNWYYGQELSPLERRINEIRYCTERGMYQQVGWDQQPIGDYTAYVPAVASTSTDPAPPAGAQPKATTPLLVDDPAPPHSLHRTQSVVIDMAEIRRGKQNESDSDEGTQVVPETPPEKRRKRTVPPTQPWPGSKL